MLHAVLLALTLAEADERPDSRVLVWIEGPPDVTLHRDTREGFRYVCEAPCGERVERIGRYTIKGDHFTGGLPIAFRDEAEVRLVVSPEHRGQSRAGRWMAIGGVSATGTWLGLIGLYGVASVITAFAQDGCLLGGRCHNFATDSLGVAAHHPVSVAIGLGGLPIAFAGLALWTTAGPSVDPQPVTR